MLHIVAGVALVMVAYVMGSVPFAIVIGKWFWHVDVRDHGSGNVGTTNVFRVLGRRAGTLVLVGDMAKGFIPVYIAAHYFPAWFALIVALAALLGHMYSVFLRGGGGKGVATGRGHRPGPRALDLHHRPLRLSRAPADDAHGERRLDGGSAHLRGVYRSPSTSRSGTRSWPCSPRSSSSSPTAPTSGGSPCAARTR